MRADLHFTSICIAAHHSDFNILKEILREVCKTLIQKHSQIAVEKTDFKMLTLGGSSD